MNETGLENSAILLMSLGEEDAAEVLKHLTPMEVQGMGATIARLKSVPRDRMEQVLDRFAAVASEQTLLVGDTDEYLRSVLKRALGNEEAELLIERILKTKAATGIESLKSIDPASVAEMLSNEHPQIVAAVLVHLEVEHAAAVLKAFSDRHRHEVLARVATLGGIHASGMKDLNEAMAAAVAGSDRAKKSSLGGAKAAAGMLNLMGRGVGTAALDFIRDADNDLAQQVMDNMFTFDDLGRVDDKGIQALLKEVQTESLVIALKATPAELREVIFRNMSTRAGETLREELESRGPVRVADVESEQKEILKVVRRLVEEGVINLGDGGDDEFV